MRSKDSRSSAAGTPRMSARNIMLLTPAHGDSLFRPIDVLKTQATDFANAQAVDRAKQDRAATSNLNWRRAVDAGDKLLHLFPRRPLRQTFVRVDPGCVDGLSNTGRAPTLLVGKAKNRAQGVHMERDGGPLPPARHDTGEVLV